MKQVFNIHVPATTKWNTDTKSYDVIKPAYVAKVAVDIDVDRIANTLGRKAAASKGRKSAALAGAVKVNYIRAL